MKQTATSTLCAGIILSLSFALSVWSADPSAAGEHDLTELAKKTQDPTSEIITVPFLNYFNFGAGPGEDMQYILDIQPVIPIQINEDWKLLTRTVLPVIDQPLPDGSDVFGLGDTVLTTWLAPAGKSKVTWGIGPVWQIPTATDHRLGSGQWGVGPSAVVVYKHGPWVIGGLANNVFSIGGWTDTDVNLMTAQPFINYNLGRGLALSFSPVITADWEAGGGQRWTVPLGGGISQMARLGRMPVKFGISAYYNVEKPDYGAEWQLQFLFSLIIPE